MMPHRSICISISRSIATSLLLLLALSLHAQQTGGGRRLTKAQQEKLRQKAIDDSIPFFRGVSIKGDLFGLVQRAVSDYGQYEVGVRVNLKDHYFPTVELGVGEADHSDDVTLIDYSTKAPYLKAGVDFNIMKNRHDIYRVLVGLRAAYTSYKFDLYHPDVTDPVWGGTTAYGGNDVKANCLWGELVAGVEAKIWGPIRLGWSVRYKRRLKRDDGEFGKVWYVPGYGKTGNAHIDGTFDFVIQIK